MSWACRLEIARLRIPATAIFFYRKESRNLFSPSFAIAIFPFLKTSGPITIGGQMFRSTDDLKDLDPSRVNAVTEVAKMLFVQGDLRVKSASYALLNSIDIYGNDDQLVQLARVRAVLCYLYGSPHEIFDHVALTPEQVSLVVVVPDRVSIHITRSEHHTDRVMTEARAEPDRFGYVPGYRGLYNFKHYFWLEPGTRLYPPIPNLALNIQQDLYTDLLQEVPYRPDYRVLPALLDRPVTPAALRVYAALEWFNRANESNLEIDRSILNLAIAFEALLGLPEASKTERLVDAISLLLGRIERLESWAKQFYDARSRVAHEGRLGDPHFYSDQKGGELTGIYGSLMLYGRQIFRLCLSTLLVGVDLAQRADLQEKLVSSRERYEKICRCLDSSEPSASVRLLSIEQTLGSLERYSFVSEGSFPVQTIIGAVQRASSCLLDCPSLTSDSLIDAVKSMATSERKNGTLSQLTALERLEREFKAATNTELSREATIVSKLVASAWMKLATNFFWLKEEANRPKNAE